MPCRPRDSREVEQHVHYLSLHVAMNGLMASALVPLAPAASPPSACPSKNATAGRRRAMACRASAGGRRGGDNNADKDSLLWLPRRDMLTGLSGVAAGLVAYQGLANAAVKEAEKPCLKPDKVTENLLDCSDPNREYPCPPQFQSPAVVDWSPASKVSRVRQPIHLLSREYQEKYKEAVAKMKALPAENPLSFAAQAAIHQAYCDGHYRYDPERKNAPFDVHFSWVFAPWHRMYIHFYERALGQLIGDDTFALPFWNWDTPAGMVVPPLFRDAFANPLFNKNRNQAKLDKLVHLDMKDSTPLVAFDGPQNDTYKKTVNDNLCTVNNQQIKQGKDARHFLGAKLCSDMEKGSSTQGSLERMAHTALHVWVGKPGETECSAETGGVLMHDGVNYNCNNDMGFLATAGRDPLFYSHHCNIDRLWHVWNTKLGGKCFDDPEWLDASFVFYDNVENPTPVRIRFRDVVDTAALGYTYGAVDDKDLPWLNCKFTSLVPHSKDKPAAKATRSAAAKAKFPMTLRKNEPVEFPAVAVPAKEEGKHLVLVIKGVTYDPRSNNKFDVAINVPKEKALEVGPEHHEFAGSFQVVPSSKAGGGTMEGTVVLSIGDLLADIEAHGHDAVDVVIVPRTKAGIRLSSPPVIENH